MEQPKYGLPKMIKQQNYKNTVKHCRMVKNKIYSL